MPNLKFRSLDKDLEEEVNRLSGIYEHQAAQLDRAYHRGDPVSWRKHPLSPHTPLFLSILTANLSASDKNQGIHPKIIDLGCGAGEKTDKLRAFSLDVVGVDNIDPALKSARKLAKKPILGASMKIVKGDIRNLPFAAKSFDGAHDYLSFLHIVKEDWPKYIKSVHRVLKKGAPLLIVTFSGNDQDFYGYKINKMKERAVVFSDKYYQGDLANVAHLIESYFYFPNEKEIKDAFGKYFEVVSMDEFPHPLHKESKDHENRKLWHILLRKI